MTRQEAAERVDADLCRVFGPESETVALWRQVAGIAVRVVGSQGAESRPSPAPEPGHAPIDPIDPR